jgi:hypothetical protein
MGHWPGMGSAVPVPAAGPLVSGVPGIVVGADAADAAGLSDSSSVARAGTAASLGRYSGPLWPQPASAPTTPAARASRRARALTRILETFDMVKL